MKKIGKIPTLLLACCLAMASGCEEEPETNTEKAEFNGHSWVKYGDGRRGSLTHDPDCRPCLERQKKMIKEAVEAAMPK